MLKYRCVRPQLSGQSTGFRYQVSQVRLLPGVPFFDIITLGAPVAQWIRAPVFGTGGREFESLRVYQKGRLMNILETENLSKIYKDGDKEIRAVDNVSLKIKKGEFVAIVGASGSGKSTLLHLIGGVDRPTSGRVLVDGQDIFKYSDDQIAILRRRQIGIIYQFYNLIPSLNVVDNITLPSKLDHQKIDPKRVDELLKILKLTRQKTHLPNQLSGGQQQRVAIGRALINYPAIVLADEPTGNLDSKNSADIIDLLKYANQKYDQTIIVITHDLNIAKQADRVITFQDGKIIKDKKAK